MAVDLTTVEAAIEAVQTNGQSFVLDGIQYTAANLGSLIKLREQLQRDTGRGSTRPPLRGFKFTGMAY